MFWRRWKPPDVSASLFFDEAEQLDLKISDASARLADMMAQVSDALGAVSPHVHRCVLK